MKYSDRIIPSDRIMKALGLSGQPSGNNLYIRCPLHNDSSPSFSFNIENGLWICFGKCGQGSLDQLVSRVMGMTLLDAHHYLLQMSEPNSSYLENLLHPAEKDELLEEIMDEEGLEVFCPDWFKDRGFDESDIDRWNIKCGYDCSIYIPLDNGYIKRFSPPSAIRYQYSVGLKKSEKLFGFSKISFPVRSIIVVEGPLDAMWGVKNGFNTVAILGSFISDIQMDLLSKLNPEEVCLALDYDAAGFKAVQIFERKNKGRFNITVLPIPDGAKDIQDMSYNQLQNSYNNRLPILIAKMKKQAYWRKFK